MPHPGTCGPQTLACSPAPRTKLRTFGDRAYSVAAPTLWNEGLYWLLSENELSEQQIPRMLADEKDEVSEVANKQINVGSLFSKQPVTVVVVYLMSYKSLLMIYKVFTT